MGKSQQEFLDVYEREHAITMKVLRAYPADQADLKPHPVCKTAKQLAWVFVAERGLGTHAMNDGLVALMSGSGGALPPAPDRWEDVLTALEAAHREFAQLIAGYSDEEFHAPVHFFSGPGKMETQPRRDVAWFLLHDQIHHRGQLSIYLRIAGGKVPSIYGPSADEPWM